MKYVKRYNELNDIININNICEEYRIENYTINEDGSIDVDGDVDLKYANLSKLPIHFNKVNGHFDCANNKLTTLERAPIFVGNGFYCDYNNLTSFEDVPKEIGADFDCGYNPIIFIYSSYIKSFDNIEMFNEFKIINGNKLYLNRLINYAKLNNYPAPDWKKLNDYIIL